MRPEKAAARRSARDAILRRLVRTSSLRRDAARGARVDASDGVLSAQSIARMMRLADDA